jgi:hypothetical protein
MFRSQLVRSDGREVRSMEGYVRSKNGASETNDTSRNSNNKDEENKILHHRFHDSNGTHATCDESSSESCEQAAATVTAKGSSTAIFPTITASADPNIRSDNSSNQSWYKKRQVVMKRMFSPAYDDYDDDNSVGIETTVRTPSQRRNQNQQQRLQVSLTEGGGDHDGTAPIHKSSIDTAKPRSGDMLSLVKPAITAQRLTTQQQQQQQQSKPNVRRHGSNIMTMNAPHVLLQPSVIASKELPSHDAMTTQTPEKPSFDQPTRRVRKHGSNIMTMNANSLTMQPKSIASDELSSRDATMTQQVVNIPSFDQPKRRIRKHGSNILTMQAVEPSCADELPAHMFTTRPAVNVPGLEQPQRRVRKHGSNVMTMNAPPIPMQPSFLASDILPLRVSTTQQVVNVPSFDPSGSFDQSKRRIRKHGSSIMTMQAVEPGAIDESKVDMLTLVANTSALDVPRVDHANKRRVRKHGSAIMTMQAFDPISEDIQSHLKTTQASERMSFEHSKLRVRKHGSNIMTMKAIEPLAHQVLSAEILGETNVITHGSSIIFDEQLPRATSKQMLKLSFTYPAKPVSDVASHSCLDECPWHIKATKKHVHFGTTQVREYRIIVDEPGYSVSSKTSVRALNALRPPVECPWTLDWEHSPHEFVYPALNMGYTSYFKNCFLKPRTADERRMRLAQLHDWNLAQVRLAEAKALARHAANLILESSRWSLHKFPSLDRYHPIDESNTGRWDAACNDQPLSNPRAASLTTTWHRFVLPESDPLPTFTWIRNTKRTDKDTDDSMRMAQDSIALLDALMQDSFVSDFDAEGSYGDIADWKSLFSNRSRNKTEIDEDISTLPWDPLGDTKTTSNKAPRFNLLKVLDAALLRNHVDVDFSTTLASPGLFMSKDFKPLPFAHMDGLQLTEGRGMPDRRSGGRVVPDERGVRAACSREQLEKELFLGSSKADFDTPTRRGGKRRAHT